MKPQRFLPGDTIAAISPSWGCAGAPDVKWRYELGVRRLEGIGLHVIAAPNALRGEAFLEQNPQARADDLMWAFENSNINGIITNIGGNDSFKLLPYLDPNTILQHPKILCGYSDVTTLHLYCHRLGLSTFYGANLLTTVAENPCWHPYSKSWLIRTLFVPAPIGTILSSSEWSPDSNQVFNPNHTKHYVSNPGYQRIQGNGIVHGKLFGGNSETLLDCATHNPDLINPQDFDGAILFIEDIPQAWNPAYVEKLFRWLGNNGYLESLHGIIIGRLCIDQPPLPFSHIIRTITSSEFGRSDLPILYGINFGHASPICTLPYDANAEINMDTLSFRILESAVI